MTVHRGPIRPWYEQFAQNAESLRNVEVTDKGVFREDGSQGNKFETSWATRHADNLKKLLDLLPHGSGIDGEWEYDYFFSTREKKIQNRRLKRIDLYCDYHFMNQDGYYDGWGAFSVILRPSFSGVDVDIHGDRNWPKKHRDTLGYLHEFMDDAVRTLVQQLYDDEKQESTWITHDRFKLLKPLYTGRVSDVCDSAGG